MWKKLALKIVAARVQLAILDYVNDIEDVLRKSRAIAQLKSMKAWLRNSRSSTTRAISNLIPFGDL